MTILLSSAQPVFVHNSTPPVSAEFRTYLHYFLAVSLDIESRYAVDSGNFSLIESSLQKSPGFLRIRKRNVDATCIQRELHLAWATESVVRSSGTLAGQELACANLWTTVQLYYAIYHAMCAFQHATGWATPPENHSGMLRIIGRQVKESGFFLPPWNSWCIGHGNAWIYGGDATHCEATGTAGILQPPTPDTRGSYISTMLHTTRSRDLDKAKDKWIKRNPKQNGTPYQRVPTKYLASISEKLTPTSLFDFLYRVRLRSNYIDASAFTLSPEAIVKSQILREALGRILSSTLFMFELGILRAVGDQGMKQIVDSFRSQTTPARILSCL